MNSRRNRRWLVVILYAFIGFLLFVAAKKYIWDFWIFIVVFIIINPLIFGEFMFWGQKYGGLLKPFLQDKERPNDERELAARDLAHYRAYTVLTLFILVLLFLPDWIPARYTERLSAREFLFYVRMSCWGLWTMAETLPQAILLWSEPDIESEPERQNALSISGEPFTNS